MFSTPPERALSWERRRGEMPQLAKSTYVGVLGVEGARAEAERLARSAVAHLAEAGVPSGALGALAGYIVTRNS